MSLHNMVYVSIKNKEYAGAIESLSRAIALGVSSKEVYQAKGNAAFIQKDYDNAQKDLEKGRFAWCE